MADTILAKGAESKFRPHPEGQFVGQCMDAIDLGDSVESYDNAPPKLVPKCAIVFRTGERNEETGELIDLVRDFTVSMGDLANLRKFLEQWRGRPYTEEQIEAGVRIDKLVGQFALLTVAHKKSGKGRMYANVTAAVGVPKPMLEFCKPFTDYVRPPYLDEKKKEYAEAAKKFRADFDRKFPTDAFQEFPEALEDAEDDLPF